jgi:signal transduction histidine kinase/ligand-binding sensor domain-containing protein
MNRRKPLRLILIGLCLSLWATVTLQTTQALDPARAVTQYALKTWDKNAGLPSSAVLTMLQTRDGFLWLGTYNGLVRFDGVTFTTYNSVNTKVFTHDGIWTLCEDRDGTLWIGTNGGGLLSHRGGVFTPYPANDRLSSNIVTHLQMSTDGRLWVGTRAGLDLLEPGRMNEPVRIRDADGKTPARSINDLCFQPDGTTFLASEEGLFRLNPAATPPVITGADLTGPIRKLLLDTDGTLWIGTQNQGLIRRTRTAQQSFMKADGLPGNTVRALCRDRDGILWIGSGDGGVCRLHDGKFSTFTERDGLSNNAIQSLLEDSQGNLWIGTYRGGLNRLQNGRFLTFTTKEGLGGNTIWGIHPDGTDLWIATSDGMSRFSGGKITETVRPSTDVTGDNIIRGVLRDRTGKLWVGTDKKGLFQYDDKAKTFTPKDLGGLPPERIRALCEDRDGALWVGTQYGLARLDAAGAKAFTTTNGLNCNIVMGLTLDRAGTLWIATNGGGLNFRKGDQFGALRMKDGLPSDVIFGVYEDREGLLWALTNGGLGKIEGGKITAVTARQGLWTNNVFQILEDKSGNFWFGSDNGIFSAPRLELVEVAAGNRKSVTCTAYGRADGMISEEGVATGIATRTASGDLWFPTIQGVIQLQPERIARNLTPAPVFIRQFGYGEEMSDFATTDLELFYPRNTFEISYTALCFLAPERVKFKYRLVGLDREWIEAGTRRTAYYTSVPPGSYTFEVIAANNDGVWNEKPATVRVVVRPPFWRKWWAYLIYAAAVAVIIFLFYRFQMERLRLRAGLRERQILAEAAETEARALERENRLLAKQDELLTQKNVELEEANERLREVDRIKQDFAAMLVHDLKSPLTAVRGTMDLLKDSPTAEAEGLLPLIEASEHGLDKTLNLINEVMDVFRSERQEMDLTMIPLEPEKLLLECYREAYAAGLSHGITVAYDFQPELPLIEADPSQLGRVLSNLLSNAVKFTPRDGTVTLEARTISGSGIEEGVKLLLITVTDTGAGIPPEDQPYIFDPYRQSKAKGRQVGVGLGLAIVKRIVAAHGGNVSVRSKVGVGSTFAVVLPLFEENQAAPEMSDARDVTTTV